MSVLLSAQGLRKSYQRRCVVDGVSFDVRAGEIVGLLGPNGAGKTTSFNIVVGVVRADGGRVELLGQDVTAMPMHRRARRGLGYLAQESTVFRRLTVRENLIAVLELDKHLNAAERQARADALLNEFSLTHVADSLGETLSGGERRRTEIARSLIPGPRVMLFDEPFAGVDPINVSELQKEISALKGRGIGVLITDHNVRDTLGICDRAYILASGTVVASGSPSEIATSETARRVYLGDRFNLAP